MTREEAIVVFKAFMDNPLFSDVHKAAFSIAIHDIKQRHDWDINKLILVPKTELEQEPIEPMVEIDLYSVIKQKYIEREVLDKIRAEIEKAVWEDVVVSLDGTDEVRIPRLDPDDVFEIIDKYKAEIDPQESER